MNERFEIKPVTLSDTHPMFPGLEGLQIYDNDKQYLLPAIYLTDRAAKIGLDKLVRKFCYAGN